MITCQNGCWWGDSRLKFLSDEHGKWNNDQKADALLCPHHLCRHPHPWPHWQHSGHHCGEFSLRIIRSKSFYYLFNYNFTFVLEWFMQNLVLVMLIHSHSSFWISFLNPFKIFFHQFISIFINCDQVIFGQTSSFNTISFLLPWEKRQIETLKNIHLTSKYIVHST